MDYGMVRGEEGGRGERGRGGVLESGRRIYNGGVWDCEII
jgi:hypothetical protein